MARRPPLKNTPVCCREPILDRNVKRGAVARLGGETDEAKVASTEAGHDLFDELAPPENGIVIRLESHVLD
jgi:hypothetical protein